VVTAAKIQKTLQIILTGEIGTTDELSKAEIVD
jgi:hypothetical protein